MRKKPLLIAVCSLTVFSFIICFCDEAASTESSLYCEEYLDDPDSHRNAVLSNPVLSQLDETLETLNVNISNCIGDNAVAVSVEYRLPLSYSLYGFKYSVKLYFRYSLTGTLKLINPGVRNPEAFDSESILKLFEGKVQKIEGNSQVQEFLAKVDLFRENRDVTYNLSEGNVGLYGKYGSVTYNFSSGSVRKYTLPNSIEWNEFPEIKQAHAILEEYLLTGELSNCSIGREDHSYTNRINHGSFLYLTIVLNCEDSRREYARLKLYPDGSYEWQGIERLEKPILPTELNLDARSFNRAKAIKRKKPRKVLQKNDTGVHNPLGEKPIEPIQQGNDDNQEHIPLNSNFSEKETSMKVPDELKGLIQKRMNADD